MGSAQNTDSCTWLRGNLIAALTRLREGDFTVRLDLDSRHPHDREIAKLFNQVVSQNESITEEFNRVARVVGKEGEITYRAMV